MHGNIEVVKCLRYNLVTLLGYIFVNFFLSTVFFCGVYVLWVVMTSELRGEFSAAKENGSSLALHKL